MTAIIFDEDKTDVQHDLPLSYIVKKLKENCTIVMRFTNKNELLIRLSEGEYPVLGKVKHLEVTYGNHFADESGEGYEMEGTDYFIPNDYEIAGAAFIYRLNSLSPFKSTGFGKELQVIHGWLETQKPLYKARQYLLDAWHNARHAGDNDKATEINRIIRQVEAAEAMPDTNDSKEAWKEECRRILKEDGVMKATNFYRGKSGLGLREAHNAVIRMQEEMNGSNA